MKARVAKEKELVLLYHLGEDTEDGRKVRGVLEGMGVQIRDITDAMLALPLGGCAGLPGFPAEPAGLPEGDVPECEALIMAGLPDARVELLLGKLREAGAKVRFKAVMTPHNRTWPFCGLLRELEREESVMRAFMPVQELLKRAKQIPAAALPEGKRRKLREAVQRAQAFADGKEEPSVSALQKAGEALRQAIEEAGA